MRRLPSCRTDYPGLGHSHGALSKGHRASRETRVLPASKRCTVRSKLPFEGTSGSIWCSGRQLSIPTKELHRKCSQSLHRSGTCKPHGIGVQIERIGAVENGRNMHDVGKEDLISKAKRTRWRRHISATSCQLKRPWPIFPIYQTTCMLYLCVRIVV